MGYQPKVYRKQGGDEQVVADGGKITIESGGTLEIESGGILSIADGALEAPDMALASAKILVGNASGKAAAADMSGDATISNAGVVTIGAKKVTAAKTAIADGKVFIGGEDGAAAEKTLSGDVTVDRDGVTTIGSEKVTNAMLAGGIEASKLANGAGLASLLAAGLGASAAYAKTTDGAQTLLAANGSGEGARAVLIVVLVDETFDAGDGAKPSFSIGETDTPAKFVSGLDTATAGDMFVYAGSLTEEKALLVTGTAATGTGAGGISVTVLALPTTA